MKTVFDLHCDSVFSLMEGKDLRGHVPGVHVDLPRLRAGGVGLQIFAAYVPADTKADEAFAYACKRIDAIGCFASSGEPLCPVENARELAAALAAGKTGLMVSVENGLAIEDSLEKLEELRRRKVRVMTLVHFQHLPWVASSTGSGANPGQCPGLSAFGLRVIDAMNDLGIIPDLSHASDAAFWEVIARSKKPVIASHSCAYSLCASPRNLKDDQLKALGDSGGVAGVNFFSAFLSESFRQAYEKNNRAVPADAPVPMSLIADHIDYMVKIAGEDAVALGSDFDGIPAAPEGVTGSDFYPVLEAELKRRGYTENRVEKIFSGNFLRVLEAWE